jgi:hypothetical protein
LRYMLPETPVWVEVGTTNAAWIGTSWHSPRVFFGAGYAFQAGE